MKNIFYFNSEDLLSVGFVKSPFGVNGGVRVGLSTSFPEVLKDGCPLLIKYSKAFRNLKVLFDINSDSRRQDSIFNNTEPFLELVIRDCNLFNNTIYFYDIFSKELACELKSIELFSTKEYTKANCKLENDEFFYFDILGLSIIEDGEILGIVRDIQKIGNTDYFVLDNGSFVPYIDRYIKEICLDSKHVLTRDVRYLINL